VQGIIEAGWWAWTMFITWDTPPRKGLARVVDLTWFLIGFLCLGILSSVITAALTSQNINGSIKGIKDLLDKKVVAVETDAPIEYLKKIGITPITVKNLAEGVQKVANKEADALVHDGPRLIYLANQFNTKAPAKQQVLVLPNSFNPQTYAIAFPPNSELREQVNYALMELREAKGSEASAYESLRKKWLADQD
jgi:ABC-type amino acid transport substrate-binding protein